MLFLIALIAASHLEVAGSPIFNPKSNIKIDESNSE
jgi:hypothetical protein